MQSHFIMKDMCTCTPDVHAWNSLQTAKESYSCWIFMFHVCKILHGISCAQENNLFEASLQCANADGFCECLITLRNVY